MYYHIAGINPHRRSHRKTSVGFLLILTLTLPPLTTDSY